jgi:hypothetical protein
VTDQKPSRLIAIVALLLSILLHTLLLAGDDLLSFIPSSLNDEVVNRKAVDEILPIRFSMIPGQSESVTIPPSQATAQTTLPKISSEKLGEKIPPPDEKPEQLPDEKPTEEPLPSQPAVEPPPAFPTQVRAVLDTRYNGLPFTITQLWAMEGYRYSIHQEAKRFGFKFTIDSEGEIDPDDGLKPETYRLAMNEKIKSSCIRKGDQLEYGSANTRQTKTLNEIPQDMASLPFHVAVTFKGEAETLSVCSGKNIYQVRLKAEAEETIKLPAGTLRTLHLAGERLDPATGQLIQGYDVWLALDYLHFPVKFLGRTGNGDRMEYRIKALELEGRWVLGEDHANELQQPSQEDIPAWLKNRIQGETTPSNTSNTAPPSTTNEPADH